MIKFELTLDSEKLINKIVINQEISYWPRYRSMVYRLIQQTSDLHVTGPITNFFISNIIVLLPINVIRDFLSLKDKGLPERFIFCYFTALDMTHWVD